MNRVIDHNGVERWLGNIEPPVGHIAKAFTVYGDTPDAPMFARSEWPAMIVKFPAGPDWPYLPYVHDQDGIGQCNADATVTMAESCRLSQGLPFVALSAADLYDRINGGQDQGSILEDAIEEMLERGVGTVATCGTLWKRGMVKAPAAERVRFKFLEAYWCPTFDHHMSAVLAGFRLNSGIMWYDNYTPDGDGWLPKGTGGAGGHSVFGYKPAMRGNQFGIWHQNSWESRWGIGGRCVFPEAAYKGQVGGWFAVRSVVDEGGVVPPERSA